MAFNGFRYYLSESFKSIWYNKPMAITSIITVMGSLLLFGFFMIIGLNINYITEQVEQQCEIQAYLPMESTSEQEQQAFEAIKKIEGIGTVVFETREQAYENYKVMLGDKAVVLDSLDPGDFLPASCRISPEDVKDIYTLVEKIKQVPGVDEVVTPMDTIKSIISATNVIRWGCVFSTILLALIAVFIITNTIKLDIHARQKEIHIMKYVGATDWFIRWPFIIEGIIVGIIGAVISLTLLWISVTAIINGIAASNFNAFKLLGAGSIMPLLSVVLFVFGGLIGALGSLIAVRKHLRV